MNGTRRPGRLLAGFRDLSIQSSIVIALVVGLMVPLGVATLFDWQVRREALREALERDHREIADVLAHGLESPAWNLEPEAGRPLLSAVMADPRVVEVTVTTSIIRDFLHAEAPERRKGEALVLARTVRHGAEEIGQVEVEMATGLLEADLAADSRRVLLVMLLQLAISGGIVLALLRVKVVAPIRMLVQQSQGIARHELDRPVVWERRDEVGVLGQSMEEMRRSLGSLVAELSRRNEELLQGEQRFRMIAEAHPMPMVIMREGDWQVLFANAAFLAAFGLEEGALAALDRSTLYARPQERGRLLADIAGGLPVTDREFLLRRADGSTFPASVTARRIVYEGSPAAVLGIIDLTALRRAEAEIASQREALHQSEKLAALGSLLAGVAHELNNPLSVALGYSAMLRDMASDEGTRDRAGRIHAAAERCARIVRTFLALARQRPQSKGAVDVGRMLEATVEMLGYQLRTAGIEVVRDLAQDLPPVHGDGDQIGQVLLNLIVNAQQALQGIEPPRRLFLATRLEGGRVRVEVADNGPGIPEAIRARIFDPFFTTKQVDMGTGLGLSVSRGIVLAHDGEIEAQERPGGGACFVVHLPVSPAPEVLEAAASAEETTGGRARILVVDDEPEIGALLAEALGRDGHRVEVAASGRAAIAALDSRPFEVVLSDLRMPDLDGQALYRYLANRRPEMLDRLVLMTGDVLGPGVRGFLAEVTVPVLEKPIALPDLRRAIAVRLGQG
jgi:PAS domain S-box-containing protein